MKNRIQKIICLLILGLFIIACNNKSKYGQLDSYLDSISYYNHKIKDTISSDSLKLIFNKSSFNINENVLDDSIRIKNNDTIAYNFYILNDFNNYRIVTQQNLYESLKTKDTSRIIKSYINYGYYYLRRNIHDSAFYNFDKAQKLYLKNNQFDEINELSLNKATIQYYEADYLGCETTIFKSLSFFKKQNNATKLNIAYTLIGISKIELKEFDESIDYLNLALKLTDLIDPSKTFDGIAYNNLGLVYYKKGEYNKAIQYYTKAISVKDLKKMNLQTYTLAKQYLIFSKFKLGQTKDFEKVYDEVLDNYKKLNLSAVQPKVQLSEFYESQNQMQKAQKFALDAYDISLKERVYRDKLFALKQLTNVFPEKAKYYSNEYIKLTDSIAAVDKKIQNTFARIEYRVDELNNENLLLEQKNKLTIYYSLIIGLIVVMVFVYRWQKQKQREYILIQEQQKANEEVYNMIINQQNEMDHVKEQEQQKISRELHDGVLGKLFGVRMNLDILNNDTNSSKDDRQNYINEIIQVEKQIRQISHELSDETRSIINNYQLMIDKLVDEQKGISGKLINYEVDSKVPWDLFSAQEKINIYRIIQETFQNINKYSNASVVDFLIKYTKNKLEISILDNGKGFEVKKGAKGIGIRNMKERARIINATYKISSEVNNGTHTNIKLEVNPYKEF